MFKQLQSLFGQSASSKPEVPHGLAVAVSQLFTFDQLKTTWLSKPTEALRTVASIPLDPLRILTWNVDFASPDSPLRMRVLLTHLQSLLGEEPSIIVLLQEIHPEALKIILGHAWVRNNFAVTNTVLPGYLPTYGTVTLVSKDLALSVVCCFRVPYQESAMGRDALFVDLRVEIPQAASQDEEEGRRVLRVGNTHLESLLGRGAAFRQAQLTIIKDVLSMPEVYAGVVGGDMNAISMEDMDLVERVGLNDLWVGEGGETWGYQPPCRFPPGRLDKILVIGDVGLLRDTRVELVGAGLKAGLGGGDEESYVSDHYGLLGTIQVGISASL